MSVTLDILFRTKKKRLFPPSFYRTVLSETLHRSKIRGMLEKEVSVSAVSVDADEIRSLNRETRGKDRTTDILSFYEYPNRKAIANETQKAISLGEVVFCESFITEAAREDGVTTEEEMAFVFSHGILHLLGFRHGETMFAIQEAIAAAYAPRQKKAKS